MGDPREGHTKEVVFEPGLNSKEPTKGTAPTEAEMSLACLWNRKGSMAAITGGGSKAHSNELGQEGQVELAHLVDNDKEGHFLLRQQEAIGGSQM